MRYICVIVLSLALGTVGTPAVRDSGEINWQVLSSGGTRGTDGGYYLNGTIGQTAVGPGASLNYGLGHGFWQDFSGGAGCCEGETVGNMDCIPGIVDMGDLTILIDHLFISLAPLCCVAEGDVDLSGQPDPENHPQCVDMGDLTVLIDHLFISLNPLPPCP